MELHQAILTAEPMPFWIMSTIGIILALLGFWSSFRFLRRARMVEDTPTAKVRSAPQGYVELIGTGELVDGQSIVAPLTGQVCTGYRYKIEKRVQSGKSSHWKTIDKGASRQSFLLRDDTGQSLIDPTGAEVTPATKQIWMGHTERPTNPPRDRKSRRVAFGFGNYMYTEERMFPGDPLYAIGHFRTVGGAGDLPDGAGTVRDLLREWKRDQRFILQHFDEDGDGKIDQNEWDRARELARQQVTAQQHERIGEPGVNTLTRPAERRQPYLLSALPQEHLVKRYRWFGAGAALGFLVLGGVMSWILTVRLG
jgi:hypothetical protein